jgi:hypothetical protein
MWPIDQLYIELGNIDYYAKVDTKLLLVKSSKNIFFSTCISPDYVSHESSKEFWKNSHYENMRAGFLRGVKTQFGRIALNLMSRLSQRATEPAYYIVDCRILSQTDILQPRLEGFWVLFFYLIRFSYFQIIVALTTVIEYRWPLA